MSVYLRGGRITTRRSKFYLGVGAKWVGSPPISFRLDNARGSGSVRWVPKTSLFSCISLFTTISSTMSSPALVFSSDSDPSRSPELFPSAFRDPGFSFSDSGVPLSGNQNNFDSRLMAPNNGLHSRGQGNPTMFPMTPSVCTLIPLRWSSISPKASESPDFRGILLWISVRQWFVYTIEPPTRGKRTIATRK